MSRAKSNILFHVSGSIAAYKACFVISRLVQDGFEVQTVATQNAFQFVGRATLEGLSGKPVFSHVYEEGKMLDHIHLAQWADLFVLCPASASTINRLAVGLADDAVGALFLARDGKNKPYLIVPAMNPQMYLHPATQASLVKLQEWGVKILPVDEGHHACNDIGPGRMIDPEQVLDAIRKTLA